MKTWCLISAIFQTIVGICAIIAYIFVAVSGEPLGKWTITLILAIAFVIMGIVNVFEYLKLNKKQN